MKRRGSIDVIEDILEASIDPIQSVGLVTFGYQDYGSSPKSHLRRSLSALRHAAVINRAFQLKNSSGASENWSIIRALEEHDTLPDVNFSKFLNHNPHSNAKQIGVNEVRDYAEKLDRLGRVVAFRSLVVLECGQKMHIPMLDLATEYSKKNYKIVRSAIEALDMPGAVLSSGKSFHFYGRTLMTPKEYRVFLGKALLLAPITDCAWIAHQMIEGVSALRVNKKSVTHGRPTHLFDI